MFFQNSNKNIPMPLVSVCLFSLFFGLVCVFFWGVGVGGRAQGRKKKKEKVGKCASFICSIEVKSL